jgi:hypothetical protein
VLVAAADSALPIAVALVAALALFVGFLPVMIRDARRPLPLPRPRAMTAPVEPVSRARAPWSSAQSREERTVPMPARRAAVALAALGLLAVWTLGAHTHRSARR